MVGNSRTLPHGFDDSTLLTVDAVLLIAFGGPEKPDDIRPFLQNVVRGRHVPNERLEAVARHYELIGGKSPLNELTFRQARALEKRLRSSYPSHHLKGERGQGEGISSNLSPRVYVGMRNWHPLLADTVRSMVADNVKRIIGVIMAPQQSDASWEKYQRNVLDAMAATGANLQVDYARPFFDHPLFIKAAAERVTQCLNRVPSEFRSSTALIFTAHSIPLEDPHHERYANQIATSSRLVAERLDPDNWQVAYQSRSGRQKDPWLEPDINDALRQFAKQGNDYAVIVPIGFVCDHVEVLYDLDVDAAQTAREVGIVMLRAQTVNDHPDFIECLADIVDNRR